MLYFISTLFPITPSPEQGKSAITISALPMTFLSNLVASLHSAKIQLNPVLFIFSLIRPTLYSVKSLALILPLL